LANSDFANPVNQGGLEKYITNSGYTIDCWYGWHDTTNVHVSIQNGYVKVWSENEGAGASFTQRFPVGTFSDDKKYTFAYKTYEGNLVIDNNATRHHAQFDYVGFSLIPNQTINIVWAALYEGEYTAETLPPYIPDGYALEMVKSNGGAAAISKVWENASPNSAFAAQTVSLDLADAQLVAIVHKGATTGTVDLITFVEMNKKTQTIS
jgi:hypothetical protein